MEEKEVGSWSKIRHERIRSLETLEKDVCLFPKIRSKGKRLLETTKKETVHLQEFEAWSLFAKFVAEKTLHEKEEWKSWNGCPVGSVQTREELRNNEHWSDFIHTIY